MILYTCESGKELQAEGDSFYASKESNGSHVLPIEVAEEYLEYDEFAFTHDMKFVKEKAPVTWLPQ